MEADEKKDTKPPPARGTKNKRGSKLDIIGGDYRALRAMR